MSERDWLQGRGEAPGDVVETGGSGETAEGQVKYILSAERERWK